MYICPHDLMKLDMDGSLTGHAMKSFNQEPDQCWECLLHQDLPAAGNRGASVRRYRAAGRFGSQPLRGTDSIMDHRSATAP